MSHVELRERAQRQLTVAYEWYEGESPGLGEDLLEAIVEILEVVRTTPRAFPVSRPGIRRALVRRFPFAIHYTALDTVGATESADRIVVLAIVHTRRHPDVA